MLRRLGLDRQAICVERAGQPGQRIVGLDAFEAENPPYFATILVHKRGTAWS